MRRAQGHRWSRWSVTSPLLPPASKTVPKARRHAVPVDPEFAFWAPSSSRSRSKVWSVRQPVRGSTTEQWRGAAETVSTRRRPPSRSACVAPHRRALQRRRWRPRRRGPPRWGRGRGGCWVWWLGRGRSGARTGRRVSLHLGYHGRTSGGHLAKPAAVRRIRAQNHRRPSIREAMIRQRNRPPTM